MLAGLSLKSPIGLDESEVWPIADALHGSMPPSPGTSRRSLSLSPGLPGG